MHQGSNHRRLADNFIQDRDFVSPEDSELSCYGEDGICDSETDDGIFCSDSLADKPHKGFLDFDIQSRDKNCSDLRVSVQHFKQVPSTVSSWGTLPSLSQSVSSNSQSCLQLETDELMCTYNSSSPPKSNPPCSPTKKPAAVIRSAPQNIIGNNSRLSCAPSRGEFSSEIYFNISSCQAGYSSRSVILESFKPRGRGLEIGVGRRRRHSTTSSRYSSAGELTPTDVPDYYRYDPVGSSLASLREEAVVCHCVRTCRNYRKTSSTHIGNLRHRSFNSSVRSSTPTMPAAVDFQSDTATSSAVTPVARSTASRPAVVNFSSSTPSPSSTSGQPPQLGIPPSPAPSLASSSSQSSMASYFSFAPSEADGFWEETLLSDCYMSSTEDDPAVEEDLVAYPDTQELLDCEKTTSSLAFSSSVDIANSTVSVSHPRKLLDRGTGESSTIPIDLPSHQACQCQLCSCATLDLTTDGCGPFSPMWDWTFPTVDDLGHGEDGDRPGNYRLTSDPAKPELFGVSSSDTAVNSSTSLANSHGKQSSKQRSPSSPQFVTSSPSFQVLSSSAGTYQSPQPVVTLFNHSVNFWKMEID